MESFLILKCLSSAAHTMSLDGCPRHTLAVVALSRSIQGDPAKSIIYHCSLHNLDAPFLCGFSLP
jgi:hypothetical protein